MAVSPFSLMQASTEGYTTLLSKGCLGVNKHDVGYGDPET